MKKVILIALAVILLIGGGLTAYVANMDWNTYKNQIASRFSNTLGKKIEFGGNLNVSIFPKPHISVKNVSILNPDTSEKLASAQNVEAKLSLKALLDGTPEIETLSLIGAELWYLVDENGDSNWHQSKKGHFLDSGIEYERQTINIQNAIIHYQNKKYNIITDFEQVNADIIAESFTGPYRIDGNFMNNQDHFGFAVGLGDLAQTDDIFLNFAVTHPRTNSYILYDGNYNFSNNNFEGNFSGEFGQPANLFNTVYKEEVLPTILNVPFIFSVHLKSDSFALQMTSLALKFAEIIEGSGNINIPWYPEKNQKPTITADYQFANLNINPLLLGAQMLYENYKQQKMPYEPHTDYDVQFDLAMQRMIIGNTADSVLENVSFKGSWLNDELNIDEYYAACPGNIVWTMSGSLLADNKIPTFFIKNNIEGKNFAAFARVFGIELSAPSQAAYRNIDATFNLSGSPLEFALSDLKVKLDKSQAQGDIKIDLSGEKPSYRSELEIDEINFDNYLKNTEEDKNLTAQIQQDLNILIFLQNLSWYANLTVKTATFRGVPLRGLKMEFSNEANTLHLTNFSLSDVLGAQISLTSDILGIGSENLAFSNLEYNIKTSDISPLINKLGLSIPKWDIFKNKPMSANGTVNGSLIESDIKTEITVNKTQFRYLGKIAQHENFEFTGEGELKTTNFGGLVTDLGGRWEKLKNNSAFNCGGQISGQATNWTLQNADCTLGTAKYNGNIQVRHNNEMWFVNAKIKATEFDLGNVLEVQNTKNNTSGNLTYADDFINRPNFSRDIYNFSAYRPLVLDLDLSAERVILDKLLLQNVSAIIKNAQNKLTLDNLNFTYANANYNGNATVNYEQKPQVTGKINAENIVLENIGGKIYKITKGIASLSSDFSSAATSIEDFINELSGNIKFSINNFGINGLDFAAIAKDLHDRTSSSGVFQAVRDNLQRGHTDFSAFSGNIKMTGGVWNFTGTQLENDIVSIRMTGDDDLNSWKMNNEFVTDLKQLELPSFSFILTGQINKPTLEINVEELAKKYDAYWDEVNRQIKATQDKHQQELENSMSEAIQNIAELSAETNKLSSQLDSYIQNGEENSFRNWYKSQVEKLKDISRQIDEMTATSRKADYTLDDIEQINSECTQYLKEIDNIKEQSLNKYEQDLKRQIQNQKTTVIRYKNENSQIYREYQVKQQEKFSELAKYGKAQELTDNEELKKAKLEIENLRNQFWNASYKINDELSVAAAINNIDELEKRLQTIKQKTQNLHQFSEQITAINKQMLKNIDKIISEQKLIYKAKEAQKQKLLQKEREENKDNLLAIDNYPQQPRNTSTPPQTTKPLPILQPINHLPVGNNVSGTIIKSYDEKTIVPPQPTGLLRPLEGNIKPATGAIIVK